MEIKQIEWKKEFNQYIGSLGGEYEIAIIEYGDKEHTVGFESRKHTHLIWFRYGEIINDHLPLEEAKKYIQDKIRQFIINSIDL